MTGDGPPVPATLLVLGTGPGDPDGAEAPDLLATADAVFAGPPGPGPGNAPDGARDGAPDGALHTDPEATALFYAEAWRVERLDATDGAARLAAWADERPGRTAVLLVAGPVPEAVAFGAALDGLALLRPDLRIDRRTGARVAPPRRSPLTR